MPKNNAINIIVAIVVVLFGIAFIGLAAQEAWRLGEVIQTYAKAQSWKATPALIITVNAKKYDEDGFAEGRVYARYGYQYQGKKFVSTRVTIGIQDSSESRKLHDQLKDAKQLNATVDCYVDPDNPSSSLLDRDIHGAPFITNVLGVMLFGTVGIGMIAGTFYGLKGLANQNKLQALNLGKPWKWRSDWKQGVIDSSNKLKVRRIGLFAVSWNAIGLAVIASMITEVDNSSPKQFISQLIFIFAGVCLGFYFLSLMIRLKKYGIAKFRFEHLPGVIGGDLAGDLIVHAELARAKKLQRNWHVCKLILEERGKQKNLFGEVHIR